MLYKIGINNKVNISKSIKHILAHQIYMLYDWLMFFINNSLIKAKIFTKEKIVFKSYLFSEIFN